MLSVVLARLVWRYCGERGARVHKLRHPQCLNYAFTDSNLDSSVSFRHTPHSLKQLLIASAISQLWQLLLCLGVSGNSAHG